MRETLDAASLARWRSDPIAFIEHVLCDPETGKPFVLSEAERRFLQARLHARRRRPAQYPELVFGAIKKSGKTTLAAIIMLTMVLLYGGRFAEGYCVANDLEQAQSRVFAIIKRIVEASPLLRGDCQAHRRPRHLPRARRHHHRHRVRRRQRRRWPTRRSLASTNFGATPRERSTSPVGRDDHVARRARSVAG